jgi:hypothetical protein
MELLPQQLTQQQLHLTQGLATLAEAMRAHQGGNVVNVAGQVSMKKILDSKDFSGIGTFDGSEEKFGEWQYRFLCAVACSHERCKDLLRVNAQRDDEVMWGEITIPEEQKLGREVYHTIGLLVTGEVQVIVRSITDMNGYEAWRRLTKRYHPDTPIHRLQKLVEIISVTNAQNANELSTTMDRLDLPVKSYDAEMSHTIDGHTKTAALLGMCPPDLQDIVIQALKKPDDHPTLKNAMRTYISYRSSGPSPMDVGCITGEYYDDDSEYVGALNREVLCFNCGGKGHPARLCPSPSSKAEGKGGQPYQAWGKGNGNSKGDVKGGQIQYEKGGKINNLKGYGKGVPAKCFRCGLGTSRGTAKSRSPSLKRRTTSSPRSSAASSRSATSRLTTRSSSGTGR